ncbi:hypothetical protein APT59_00830 [Pseudomonas oryzihabitans]|uniref:Uncharacterized protein n=1 Tax=Pseudomonas oryzihabitans TaxID=47885 RepID=A0A0U4VHW3_9PSED|nr:hypothetical protein APT59_00830 [Pseudomonas oryzihabitans]
MMYFTIIQQRSNFIKYSEFNKLRIVTYLFLGTANARKLLILFNGFLRIALLYHITFMEHQSRGGHSRNMVDTMRYQDYRRILSHLIYSRVALHTKA